MRYAFLLQLSLSIAATAAAQEAGPLPLKASLVLSKELCKTEFEQGSAWTWKDKFEVGEAFCPVAETLARETFGQTTILREEPKAGQPAADVVIVPKILAASATNTATVAGTRHMIVQVEWTATDASGKPLWVQTIQGTADHKAGGGFGFNRGKNARKMMEDAVADVKNKTKAEMLASDEFLKLAESVRANR